MSKACIKVHSNEEYDQMVPTTTRPQTEKWELLGQLALLGQRAVGASDTSFLLEQITDTLQQLFPDSSGMLAAVDHGQVYAHSQWGQSPTMQEETTERAQEQHPLPQTRLPLQFGSEEMGYLLLNQAELLEIEQNQTFSRALLAQIGLLLSLQRNHKYPSADLRQHRPIVAAVSPPSAPALSPQQAGAELSAGDQSDPLRIIQRVSATTASTQKNEQIYATILTTMAQIIQADHARLLIYNDQSGNIVSIARYGLPPADTHHLPAPSLSDDPIVEWLETHRGPFIALNVHQGDFAAQWRATWPYAPVHSLVIVPLIARAKLIGAIELTTRRALAAPPSEQSLQLCQTIAHHAASTVETTILARQAESNARALQIKVSELSTILEAARILGSLLRPDEVLNNLMDLVSRQLRVTTVALWTIHEDNMLIPAAMDGAPLETARNMRVPVGQGLTGKVAQTGLPMVIKNVERDGSSYYPSFNRQNNLTSFMGVPVFYRETIIGVLSVMTTEERLFTTDEMMLMVGLSGQAAIALENARLFQERERRINELTTINNISTAINATLDVDETLLYLHRGISEVIDTTYSFIGLYTVGATGETPILYQRIIRNKAAAHISETTIPIDGKGLVDHVLFQNAPLLLNTTEEILSFKGIGTETMPRGAQQEEELTAAACNLSLRPASWLGVPIILGNEVQGIINIQNIRPHAYTPDDLRFLTTVASQAAIAISNARLFSERERRLREITVLKDIGRAISSTLDLQLVLDRLYHELAQAIDMRTAVIGIYDEQTQMLSYPVCHDQGRRVYLEPSALSDDANGWVIRNRQPLLIHTNEQRKMMGIKDFGFTVFDLRSGLSKIRHPQSRPIQSLLVTPIITNERVLGFISVKSYQPYAFDENDLRFLTTVTSQVAITISNIYLFLERERRIEELATFNEIGQALSATVRIDELPNLIYRQTSRLLDTNHFYMALYNDAQQEITFPLFYEAGTTRTMEKASIQQRTIAGGHSSTVSPGLYRFIVYLTRRVIHKRQPILLQDLDLQTGEWDIELREELGNITTQFNPPHSWLGVPMIAANKVIGVIGIQDYDHTHIYGPAEVRLLSTIASWAAIALENAHLFDQMSDFATSLERSVAERTMELEQANIQLRQEKDHLETVHAITLELTSILDLDEIIHRSLEVASTNLGVARGSIMLREIQSGQLICRAVLQDRGMVKSAELPISFGKSEGLVGWVMQNQESVCISDVRKDTRWVLEEGRADDVRSVAAAPLMTGDSTLGVLILTSPTIGYFTDSQIRLLATIANEVAIAINNAQLYGYITEMATRLADLLEQQKEETSKSQAILQSLTEGVIVLDQDEQIELVNWAAEHMLNIPAIDVLNQPMNTLTTYEPTEAQKERAALLYQTLLKGLESVRENQTTYSTSLEFCHPTQMVAMNIAPVVGFDGQNYGNVAVLRDVTREIQADQAKREFISKVSHELRTPLTSIRGYIDLLIMESMGPLNETQLSFLDVVKTNSNRLMDLINDILDISRIESGKINLNYTEFDIREVIDDVYQSLRLEAAAKNISVTIDTPDTIPVVCADEKRITQVIFNMFSNAVKYTYNDGQVWIRVSLNPAQMIQVDVEDTGVGMTPDQLDKLFRPFYRADSPLRESVGGTGLGLSIARSLVEQHNGEMWVKSEQGKGSIFSFIIPLTHDEETGADEVDE